MQKFNRTSLRKDSSSNYIFPAPITFIQNKLGLKKIKKTTIYTSSGCAGRVRIILIAHLVLDDDERGQIRKEAAISDPFCVVD